MRRDEPVSGRGSHAQATHGRLGCEVNIDDLADRPPRPLDNGDVIDIGAHRLRYIATPHVPHAWDAGVYYDETTSILLCGDLFTAVGQSKALVNSELVGGLADGYDERYASRASISGLPYNVPEQPRSSNYAPALLRRRPRCFVMLSGNQRSAAS